MVVNKLGLSLALICSVVLLQTSPAASAQITWGSRQENVAKANEAIATGINTKFLAGQCVQQPQPDCATSVVSESQLNRAYLVTAADKIYTGRLVPELVTHPVSTINFLAHTIAAAVGVVFGSTRNPYEVSDPQDLYTPEEFQPWHEN